MFFSWSLASTLRTEYLIVVLQISPDALLWSFCSFYFEFCSPFILDFVRLLFLILFAFFFGFCSPFFLGFCSPFILDFVPFYFGFCSPFILDFVRLLFWILFAFYFGFCSPFISDGKSACFAATSSFNYWSRACKARRIGGIWICMSIFCRLCNWVPFTPFPRMQFSPIPPVALAAILPFLRTCATAVTWDNQNKILCF